MTPERMRLIAKWRAHCDVNHGPNDGLCAACTDGAITEAVAEEHERCAKIAEAEKCGLGPEATPMDVAYADGYSRAGDNIAAVIRARGRT